MTAPNMATIAASLERSLQNCNLNHHQQQQTTVTSVGGGVGSISSDGFGGGGTTSSTSSTSDDAQQNHHLTQNNIDAALELNSHVSLPYHWEQCLDLKTGEIYYINWRNGMKAKEDPRRTAEYSNGDSYYYSEEDEDSSYDSEESSTESSPSSCRERYAQPQQVDSKEHNNNNNVLVVAGCKACLMYVMVPKQLGDCPKCSGELLHFDRTENGSL